MTVGEVVELERVGWHAAATLRIQDDVELPANAVAQIRQTSLLGEKYVALEAPTEEPADGALGPTATSSAWTAPTATPSSRRCSARWRSSSTAAGSASWRPSRARSTRCSTAGATGCVTSSASWRRWSRPSTSRRTTSSPRWRRWTASPATLNREKRTVTRAIDAFGPAVTVLADQHEELIRMLKALDRLGEVGTRVIDATQEDLIASLRHLRPVLREIADVDSELPEALGLLVSFPFPIESNDIVHGDYANTDIVFSIDLDQFLRNMGGDPGGGDEGPGLPGLPALPEICRRCRDPRAARAAGPAGHPRSGTGGGARAAGGRRVSGSADEPRRAAGRWAPMMTRGVKVRLVGLRRAHRAWESSTPARTTSAWWTRSSGRGYTVTAQLPTSGGLYEGSLVTYRGVQVGKVGGMQVADDGVAVRLDLEDEARIPADSAGVRAQRLRGRRAVPRLRASLRGRALPGSRGHRARRPRLGARRRGRPARGPRRVRPVRRPGRPARWWSRSSATCSAARRVRCSASSTTATSSIAEASDEQGRDDPAARPGAHGAADPAGQRRQHPRLRLGTGRGHRCAARERPRHPADRRGRARDAQAGAGAPATTSSRPCRS